MGNYTHFYTIGFYDKDGNGINRDIATFLNKIEKLIKANDPRVIRSINKEIFRPFLYYRDQINDEIIVVPLGKPIRKNKPYAAAEDDPGKLIELKAEMFDINFLVYSKRHKVAMYTTNSRGPSQQEFCAYLNSYLKIEDNCFLKMSPITFNKTLENVRSSKRVTSMLVSVDLGDDTNNYFRTQVEQTRTGLLKTIFELINSSKDTIDARYLTFNVGLGKGKKTESLNKESILTLLGQMNLDSRFIKEIELKYEDNRTEKIEAYKIKNTDTILRGRFKGSGTKLAPEFLLANAEEVYMNHRDHFIKNVTDLFDKMIPGDYEEYELNLDWRETSEE